MRQSLVFSGSWWKAPLLSQTYSNKTRETSPPSTSPKPSIFTIFEIRTEVIYKYSDRQARYLGSQQSNDTITRHMASGKLHCQLSSRKRGKRQMMSRYHSENSVGLEEPLMGPQGPPAHILGISAQQVTGRVVECFQRQAHQTWAGKAQSTLTSLDKEMAAYSRTALENEQEGTVPVCINVMDLKYSGEWTICSEIFTLWFTWCLKTGRTKPSSSYGS